MIRHLKKYLGWYVLVPSIYLGFVEDSFMFFIATQQTLNSVMNLMLNHLSKVTPQTNPELWYQWYSVVKEDAP